MSRFHFVGVGGIGMSGLAQLLIHQGHRVSGSDRGLGLNENARVFDALRSQGVSLFSQDGSYLGHGVPDQLVLSTAIEADNPDLVGVPKGVRRAHRSEVLSDAIRDFNGVSIAVTGSCGKTTVTSWLGESLDWLDLDPTVLSGGLVNHFAQGDWAGNFRPGKGPFVFEADESDKSLLAYAPDFSVVLNAASDHYPRAETLRMFGEFLRRTRRAALVERSVLDDLPEEDYAHLKVSTFGAEPGMPVDWRFDQYTRRGRTASVRVNERRELRLPVSGRHNAGNAIATLGALALLDSANALGQDAMAKAVERFHGVWRRFNIIGETRNGVVVIDDYAHNVDKIVSCLKTAREVAPEGGGVTVVFQPHGYGPLALMRGDLFDALEATLSDRDQFAFLPVYYAGGTSSFTPESSEVASEYSERSDKNYAHFPSREVATERLLDPRLPSEVIVVMGARDNSLAQWAASLTQP